MKEEFVDKNERGVRICINSFSDLVNPLTDRKVEHSERS
jgi:hypothetical protein